MDKATITFVKNALRRASSRWGPIWRTKLKSRRNYVGGNKRQKYEYECSSCRKCFPNRKVNVDHIVPVGAIRSDSDLVGYIERLLCAEDGLQVLCTGCHRKKTNGDNKTKIRN
jgi:5-methylcytosine-specific restriction endonuclease McrA